MMLTNIRLCVYTVSPSTPYHNYNCCYLYLWWNQLKTLPVWNLTATVSSIIGLGDQPDKPKNTGKTVKSYKSQILSVTVWKSQGI